MRKVLTGTVFVCFLFFSEMALASAEGARNFVLSLSERAVSISKSSDPLWLKKCKVQKILREGLDFVTISKFVLGVHWRGATNSQRGNFLGAFEEYVLQVQSGRFAQMKVKKIEHIKSEPAGSRGIDTMVHVKVHLPNREPVDVRWRVRMLRGKYKIIDITLGPASMLMTYRSEISSQIRNHGLNNLISGLSAKAAELKGPNVIC